MTVMHFQLAIKLADQEENQSASCCVVLFEPFIQKEPTGHRSLGVNTHATVAGMMGS